MNEQSHKREMSDAVRADFERLRRRGVVSTIPVSQAGDSEAEELRDGPAEPEPAAQRSFVSRLFRRG